MAMAVAARQLHTPRVPALLRQWVATGAHSLLRMPVTAPHPSMHLPAAPRSAFRATPLLPCALVRNVLGWLAPRELLTAGLLCQQWQHAMFAVPRTVLLRLLAAPPQPGDVDISSAVWGGADPAAATAQQEKRGQQRQRQRRERREQRERRRGTLPATDKGAETMEACGAAEQDGAGARSPAPDGGIEHARPALPAQPAMPQLARSRATDVLADAQAQQQQRRPPPPPPPPLPPPRHLQQRARRPSPTSKSSKPPSPLPSPCCVNAFPPPDLPSPRVG